MNETPPPHRTLSAELEAALVRALLGAWRDINHQHFKNGLRPPQLGLHDGDARLGQWDPRTRFLTLSRTFVVAAPWPQVVEVLKHEVAHQFVHEVLGVHDETAHGPTFSRICAAHGIDGAARGTPQAEGDDPHPILRRVAKLLALAESPNLHEAELAMKQAQRLMLKHNIEAAAAQAAEGYSFRHVGTPKSRRSSAEKALGGILERFFFVCPIWVPFYVVAEGKDAWILELTGTPSNLDVAAWVYDFVLATAERLWRDHKRQRNLKANGDRRAFLFGVMAGFEAKLAAGVVETRQEGLVWKGDPKLRTYYHRRHPRIRSTYASAFDAGDAYESGHRAGRDIILSRPVSGQRGDSASGLRLLPARQRP